MKWRKLPISIEFLKVLLNGRKQIFQAIKNTLPPDTTFIKVYTDEDYQMPYLIIQSVEFEDVPEGQIIPKYIPEVTSYYEG
jgi:hypothetical protein